MTSAVAALAGLCGDGQCAGGGVRNGVHVEGGHAPVEADGLVGDRQREGDGMLGADDAELPGGHGGASLAPAVEEWMAAVFAAEPTAMPRSMSRTLQTGPANSSSALSSRSALVAWRNSAQVA
jgi:hypothetical protein